MINKDWMLDENGNLMPSLLDITKTGFQPRPEPVKAVVPDYGNTNTTQPQQPQQSGGLLSAIGGGDFDWRGALSKLGAAHLALSQDPMLQKIGAGRLEEMKKLNTSNQMKNRTVQELMRRGRKDLAQAVQSGLMSPTDAAKEMFRRVEGIEFQGKLVNPYTGEVISEGDGSTLTKDQLSSLNTIRDDFRADTSGFQIVSSGYKNITEFYNNPSSVGDYALAVAFAKVLDPGSVAREGEVDAVRNAGAKVPALGQALKNAVDGTGALTDEVRQQIADLATKIYANQLQDARATFEHYKEVTKAAGIDPKYLYGGDLKDPKAVLPAKIPKELIPAGATPEEAQKWWNSLSVEEKRKQLSGTK